MITIKDVAKKADVSIGTASRALRNVGYVSEDVKKKVLSSAKELGYVVNYPAQQLKSGDSVKTVGIILSEIYNEYFFKVISNLELLLHGMNMNLIVTFSSKSPVDEENSIRYLIGNRVSTILFIPTTDKNVGVLELAKKNGIKVIQLFIKVYEDFDAIVNDDELGAYLATKRLLAQKCKKLLFLDVGYRYLDFESVKPNRTHGFLHALDNSDIVKHSVLNTESLDDFEMAFSKRLETFKPDGIIAGTGVFGFKVMQYFKKHTAKAKFISFDDNQWLDFSSVTSIRQDMDALIKTICDFIVQPSSAARYAKIPETLVTRD